MVTVPVMVAEALVARPALSIVATAVFDDIQVTADVKSNVDVTPLIK